MYDIKSSTFWLSFFLNRNCTNLNIPRESKLCPFVDNLFDHPYTIFRVSIRAIPISFFFFNGTSLSFPWRLNDNLWIIRWWHNGTQIQNSPDTIKKNYQQTLCARCHNLLIMFLSYLESFVLTYLYLLTCKFRCWNLICRSVHRSIR